MSTYLEKAKSYIDPQHLHNYAMNGLNAALADSAIPFRKANILGSEALSVLSGSLVTIKEAGKATLKSAEKIVCSNGIYLIQFAKKEALKDKLEEVSKYEIKAGFTPAVNQFYGVLYAIKAIASEILFFAMASFSQENVNKQKEFKNFAPAENEIAKLTAQIASDKTEADAAKSKAVEDAVKEKQATIDTLSAEITALKDGKEADVKAAIEAKQQEITKLSNEIADLKTQHQAVIDAKDQDIANLKTNVITLEGQIQGLQQKVTHLEEELDKKQNEFAALKKLKEEIDSLFAAKTKEYDAIKQELEALKAAPPAGEDAFQATVKKLIDEKADLEQQIEDLTKQLGAKEAEVKKATEDFEKAFKKIAEQKTALADLVKENQAAKDELAASAKKFETLEAEHKELNKNHDTLLAQHKKTLQDLVNAQAPKASNSEAPKPAPKIPPKAHRPEPTKPADESASEPTTPVGTPVAPPIPPVSLD